MNSPAFMAQQLAEPENCCKEGLQWRSHRRSTWGSDSSNPELLTQYRAQDVGIVVGPCLDIRPRLDLMPAQPVRKVTQIVRLTRKHDHLGVGFEVELRRLRTIVLRPDTIIRIIPFAVAPLTIGLLGGQRPFWLALVVINLAAFMLLAMNCHWELYRRRPTPNRLTEFYLLVSLCGVLGGT